MAVASLYQPYLITRQTGRAVRDTIERLASERPGAILTVLDLTEVAVIDFSCADEVVAKLVLSSQADAASGFERYFLIRGLDNHHADPVGSALRRRGLAVAAQLREGDPVLLGEIGPESEAAWKALSASGRARAEDVARLLGIDPSACGCLLDDLYRRRLVRRRGDEYESLVACLAAAGPDVGDGPDAGDGATPDAGRG